MRTYEPREERDDLIVEQALHITAEPGDMTRYDLVAVRVQRMRGAGNMGYVNGPAWLLTCGMTGKTMLVADGDYVAPFYAGEKFGLTNARSVEQYTKMVNDLIGKERTG